MLRPTTGDRGLIERLLSDYGYPIRVHEFTYADYIWAFCIDEELKSVHAPIAVANYTDQAVLVPSGDDSGFLQKDSAREFFSSQFASSSTPTAHVLIAPGGMGKTSLCLALVADLLKVEDRQTSVALIQVEMLRKYFVQEGAANVRIRSVYDLYELYSKAQGHTRIYDATTFDLAVLCGNIIVIIDGLDELASLLQERFELDRFLKSIETLHDELGSSQFLLTTRSGLTVGNESLDQLDMRRYELLGFSEADWMRYARRRFAKYNIADKLSEKLRNQLSKVQVQDEVGRVIPFFVDILATILEEEIDNTPDGEFEVSYQPTPYPSNNELTDHIVCSVFRREEVRHDLGISVSQIASFLAELVVDFGESIAGDEIIERLKLLYDERAMDVFQKLSLNPLLSRQGDVLKLRYGFLGDYFPVLFLIASFIQRSRTPEFVRCLVRLNAPDSTEFKEVWRYFSTRQEEFHEHAKSAIASLRMQSLGEDQISNQLCEEARRATSAVLRLYAAVWGLTGSKLTDRLLELFDAVSDDERERSIVTGLCVYGDFPSIDFSNLTVTQGRFIGYTKFIKCKFDNARFLYCKFDRCRSSEAASDSFSSALFDASCDLGDLTQALQMVTVGKEAEDAMVESEVRKFLHCFFKGDRFVDTKTAHMKFSYRLSGLSVERVDRLIKKGFLEVKVEKHDETYYEISNALKPSVYRFLVNNYVDGNIQKLIEFVR